MNLINNQPADQRFLSAAIDDKDFSKEIFLEIDKLKYQYIPFIGWRSKVIDLKHIQIQKDTEIDYPMEKVLLILLGFWGRLYGGLLILNLEQFQVFSIKKLINQFLIFGELGWVSRQSLNQLLNAISDGNKPSLAIFYSGLNDIGEGCKVNRRFIPSHTNNDNFQKSINNSGQIVNLNLLATTLIEPYKKIITIFDNKYQTKSKYDCHLDENKAQNVARHLVGNWYYAYLISEANGFDFLAILQPYLLTSEPSINLSLENQDFIETSQYKFVIPFINAEVKSLCSKDKDFVVNIWMVQNGYLIRGNYLLTLII